MRPFGLRFFVPGLVLLPAAFCLIAPKAYAIPPFSRKYQTSCSTCHLDFPKLNDFGKAFKDAGFKFPADDETYVKNPPVMLGAEASKDQFPKSIWPGEIPGMPPVGLRYNQFFQYTGSNRNQFNSLAAPGTVPGLIPATDFEAGFFSIFTAGNFGSDIAFWVDDDLSVSGDNSAGGLGDGYLKFVNIGRLMKLPKDSLSLRAGQFELDLPFTQARTINLSPYDIYQQANIGAALPGARQQNVGNQFTLRRMWREASSSAAAISTAGITTQSRFSIRTRPESLRPRICSRMFLPLPRARMVESVSAPIQASRTFMPARPTVLIWSAIPKAGTTFRPPAPWARGITRT